YYPAAMVVTTACMFFVLVPLLLLTGIPTIRNVPAWQRKHFITVWIGHLVAMAVVLANVWVGVGRDDPANLLYVYPLWATTAAMSFLAHATEAGIYYMVAAVMFCLAIVMALTPHWAPLEVAFFMSGNLTMQGLYMRRRTQQPATVLPIGSESATTV